MYSSFSYFECHKKEFVIVKNQIISVCILYSPVLIIIEATIVCLSELCIVACRFVCSPMISISSCENTGYKTSLLKLYRQQFMEENSCVITDNSNSG